MKNRGLVKLDRREFLGGVCSFAALPSLSSNSQARKRLSLVIDTRDSVAGSLPAGWATNELARSLNEQGVEVVRFASLSQTNKSDFCIVVSGSHFPVAAKILKRSRVVADKAEALALVPTRENGRDILLACGSDARGLVYALLELGDRVRNAANPFSALALRAPVAEQPANSVRSVLRLFASDVEDKPWYNDRDMWPRYLTMLATQRFNRFNLSLSLGYDFLRRVTDAYFLFPYPFLLSVPGYNVRVPQLPEAERNRNLEMLKFISEQTVARGMEFQLGLWMHGYEWIDSPNANYTVEGLTSTTHAPYCRDALRLLLQTCPAVSGVTIRTHGERGRRR